MPTKRKNVAAAAKTITVCIYVLLVIDLRLCFGLTAATLPTSSSRNIQKETVEAATLAAEEAVSGYPQQTETVEALLETPVVAVYDTQ